MARLPWGGRALAGPRSLSGALSSSPIAARGLDVSRGRRSQKGGVSGRTGVGGIAWEGRAPARPGSCQKTLSSSWCSTLPEARRSRGGGGSERVGRSVGALPGRDEHRLVRGVAGGYFIELVLDVPRGTTFPGVASPGGPPARGVAHLRYTIRAAPEPRSAARAAVVAAAVPAVAGAFAVGGCGGGLFGFHGIVGGLFLGAAVALGYRLEQFFLRRHALQLATQQLLDRRQLEGVVLAGEADRGALGAGAAGPADTVHVVLRIIRQGVVDHVADAVDVNTTAGDIGGDQYPQLAFAEVLQGAYPLVLRHVAGQLGGVDAIAHQALLDAAHLVLAVGEHHDPVQLQLGDQVVQQLVLVIAADRVDLLGDVLRGGALGFDLDDGRIHCPLLGQVHHVIAEGGGEQQGLPVALARGLADDLPHLGNEAHVEHAVGLVEDQHLDQIQMHFATVAEVQQASRGGYQDVAVLALQLLELLVVIHATDEGHDVQPAVSGQALGIAGDLHDQFPGQDNDQRPRLAHVALVRRRGFQQLGDGRNEEGGGLAGTGLGAADGVVTEQGAAQYLGLDRGAVLEALILNTAHQAVRQGEVVEAGLAFGRFHYEIIDRPGLGGGLGCLGLLPALALTAFLLRRPVVARRGRCRGGRAGRCWRNRRRHRLDMRLVVRSRCLARLE